MKILQGLLLVGALLGSISGISAAFHLQSLPRAARSRLAASIVNAIDIDESAPRALVPMEEWATACGVQKAEGVQLTVSSQDDLQKWQVPIDIGVTTTQDLPASTPVLFVPNNMILSSVLAQQEFGPIEEAEHLPPHFYLFVKLLKEYEVGDQSPWYPWLNSLPRCLSNGACLTYFCYECLPPLARRLSLNERTRFSQFFKALKFLDLDILSLETKTNRKLAKWAFAIVYTRSFEVGPDDIRIVPMADMFNHGSIAEVQINYDEAGNCYAYTTYDVPAGYPLRMSYTNGDNTNPSKLFARYGFLDESSPATFCKIMIARPSQELINLGYAHNTMLFYKDTGGVSQEVWDVLLYRFLQADPQTQQAFYQAHMNGDYATKQAIHEQYYVHTSAALRNHVDTFLEKLEKLSGRTQGRNLDAHPRLPLIQKHNAFVKKAFLAVQAQL